MSTETNELVETKKTFTLLRPVKDAKGEEITTITIDEPTAGQIEMAEKQGGASNNSVVINLCALAAGVNAMVIRSLGARDYKIISEYVDSFLEDSPTTGKTA